MIFYDGTLWKGKLPSLKSYFDAKGSSIKHNSSCHYTKAQDERNPNLRLQWNWLEFPNFLTSGDSWKESEEWWLFEGFCEDLPCMCQYNHEILRLRKSQKLVFFPHLLSHNPAFNVNSVLLVALLIEIVLGKEAWSSRVKIFRIQDNNLATFQ